MDIHFNGYKIRYELINKEILPLRASQNIKNVNIYINLDDLFHKLHKPYTDNEFQCIGTNATMQLVSNIINLVGHYKHWASKEKMNSKIYLVYTKARLFKNDIYVKNYRAYAVRINELNNLSLFHVNSVLNEAYSLFHTILKYIPNCYIIDSGYIEPSVVPLYLSGIDRPDLNIMISRDEYDLQYTSLPKWVYISPKGDNSTIITNGAIWEYIKNKEKITEEFNLHPDIFIWAKAIVGDKYRSIPKLTRTGWKTIINYLRDSSCNEYNNEVFSLQMMRLSTYLETKHIASEDINNNMSCISIPLQCNSLMEIDIGIITSQIVDMEDMNTLYSLNNNMFRLNPLNLSFILHENVNSGYKPSDRYHWMK